MSGKRWSMITVEETDSGLYVTDAAKNELHIEIPDWQVGGEEQEIYRKVDHKISGKLSEIRFPASSIILITEGRDEWRIFSPYENDTVETGMHQLQVSTNVFVYLRFQSSFKIRANNSDDEISIIFPNVINVTIAFRAKEDRPSETIRVTNDISDISEAVSYLSSYIGSEKPDRSYPSLRPHPPLIETGDELSIPDSIKDQSNFSGITFKLNNQLESVFIVSPLAYYLGAKIETNCNRYNSLVIQDKNITIELPTISKLQKNVVDLMHRVFWLDCLVRNAGQFPVPINEYDLINNIDLNPEEVYDLDIQTRFFKYLNVDFGEISDDLPQWHLVTHIDPTINNVSTLSYLLDKLSLIILPESRRVNRQQLLEKYLDSVYRASSQGNHPKKEVPVVEPRIPEYQQGRFHAWVADKFPVGVFKASPKSFENRTATENSKPGSKSISVVVNDKNMSDERHSVSSIYEERSNELSIDLTIEENITTGQLANVFEKSNDFVHYIGHCNNSGLECSNGNLSASSLSNVGSKTFFLNACGSFQEGLNLVENGSVGGVVTRNKVLDQTATRIGTEFARLIMHGFNLEHASNLAKNKSITSYEYSVVGDGTFVLSQSVDPDPPSLKLDQKSDDEFIVQTDMTPIQDIGKCHRSHLSNGEKMNLMGNPQKIKTSKSELINYLETYDQPVIFEGTYYWSDELSIKLQN